jgi:hypothetical protein
MEYYESVSIVLGVLIVLIILFTMSVPTVYYFYFQKRLQLKQANETFFLVSVFNSLQNRFCRNQSEESSVSPNDIP